MPKSTEKGKPVIIDTVKGRTDTESNSQDHFFPVDPDGKPIRSIKNAPEPVYDKKGKLLTEASLGKIVDVKA